MKPVFVILGIALAALYVLRTGRRQGYGARPLLELAFGLVASGIVGARVLYLVKKADHFVGLCTGGSAPRGAAQVLSDCLAPLRFWEGGAIFVGGALGAGFFAYWFTRRRGWSFLAVADLFAPAAALGHAVGRVGCLAAGCCYGHICPGGDGLFCMRFPAGSAAHEDLGPAGGAFTAPLYATQIFEVIALLLLFAGLMFLRRRPRRSGFVFASYLVGYGVLRSVLEFYRFGVEPRFVWELGWPALARTLGLPEAAPLVLTQAQLVCMAFVVGGLIVLRWRRGPVRAPTVARVERGEAPAAEIGSFSPRAPAGEGR